MASVNIKQEIARIQGAKETIKTWANQPDIALYDITDSSKINEIATVINNIQPVGAIKTTLTTSGEKSNIPAGYLRSPVTITGPTFTKYYTGSSKPSDSQYSNGDIFLVI